MLSCGWLSSTWHELALTLQFFSLSAGIAGRKKANDGETTKGDLFTSCFLLPGWRGKMSGFLSSASIKMSAFLWCIFTWIWTSVLGSVSLPPCLRQRLLCDNRVGKPVVLFCPKWHIWGIILKAKRHTCLIHKPGWAQVAGLSSKKRKIMRKMFCGMLSHYYLMSCFSSKRNNTILGS